MTGDLNKRRDTRTFFEALYAMFLMIMFCAIMGAPFWFVLIAVKEFYGK